MATGLSDQELAHPLVHLIELLESSLDDASRGAAWTLSPRELTTLLPRLARVRNQLDAVESSMLREADRLQVGDPVGAASTAGWWASATRATRSTAHQRVALATALDDDQHTPTRTAFGDGRVAREQAVEILRAIEALPKELVDPMVRTRAENHLVELAEHHDARDLRILGRRILDVIAPEVSEEHQRRTLENEEAQAAATASFTMNPDGHGSMVGRFKIPVLAGEMLAKHLRAIAAPKHHLAATHRQSAASSSPSPGDSLSSGDGPSAGPSRPLRLGQAFTEYLETRDAIGLPKAGGVAATVVVTMTLENLLGNDRAATLDSGQAISASEARRLACEAGIIPAVLGSRSQVLDLGRKSRFHTEPQRVALALRDQGCAVEHCDWPPGMCHAHHPTPWSQGGRTSIQNGQLLCPRHHTLAHDARYQLATSKSGKVTFSRRI